MRADPARAARRAAARSARAAHRAARRATIRAAAAALGRAARPVVPLLLVTGFAGIGQVLWALDHVAPPTWGWPLRVVMAIGAAAAVESISLNVQWHAHDAHVHGRMASAARLRRASYVIAALVAAINYAHFAGPDGSITPAAVMFALFSAASPWLWGLHTRRVREIHLAEAGAAVDTAGAVFAPIRWRLFPLRTFGAWRWSIDHAVIDPTEAWTGYSAERAAERAGRRAERSAATTEPAATTTEQADPAQTAPPSPSVAELPVRPTSVALATVPAPVVRADTRRPVGRRARAAERASTRSDADVLADARAWAAQHGPITSRTSFRRATGTGGERSERLFDSYQREETAS